jgi:uncharacterized protein DUF4124
MPRFPQPAIPAAALALALSAVLPAGAEQVYKWVDEKGVTHFSQTPPEAKDAQRLDVRTAPATPSPGAASDEAKAKDADAKPQRTEAQKKERAERCKQAQEALAKLEGSEPIVRYGEKGEQIPVGDDERPAFIQQVKKVMAQQCGD